MADRVPRVIGLLGGMSWESSAIYYRLVNEGVRDALGGLHSARVVMVSVDFAEVEAMQVAGRWDDAGRLLASAAQRLVAGGAECVVLCTNTMHKVAGAIEDAVDVPFLHLADTTADAVLATGVRRVGLLGTAFTMEQDFYADRLRSRGIDVVVPGSVDRADVHRIIYDELCLGVVRDPSRERYREVMAALVADGCEGIVLGCTEIEMLVGPDDASVPTFPTTTLHAQAAVRWAVS